MENKEKVTWGTIFGVASVWFGAHAGGGFASGNQTMNFFCTVWMACNFYTGNRNCYAGVGL